MRFELDDDQRDFAAALESLLAGADTPAVARAWADGDHDPGLRLWTRLAELGVGQLAQRHPEVVAIGRDMKLASAAQAPLVPLSAGGAIHG